MRILIHSNAPWVPTGYGVQANHLGTTLRGMGHEVTYSAISGLSNMSLVWDEFPVLPSCRFDFGIDAIVPHAKRVEAELIVPFMDFYKLFPVAVELADLGVNIAPWIPVDCTPLGFPDKRTLQQSSARPIGMSVFGQNQLRAAGFEDALYAPHVVDTGIFKPHEDRGELRKALGLDDRFVIGMCAANNDGLRKSFPEQFEAFRRFRKDHDEAILLVHTIPNSGNGHDLVQMARDLEIAEHVRFSDPYEQLSGQIDAETMSDWYNCLDVLSLCSYAEGFGVPLIEAQACGVPVITTDAASMHELSVHGWRVAGERYWNPVHRAWWTRPDVHRIVGRYQAAYREKGTSSALKRSKASVDFAAKYAVSTMPETWSKILEELS